MNDGILGNRDVTCVEVWWPAGFWSVPDSMQCNDDDDQDNIFDEDYGTEPNQFFCLQVG